MGAREGKNWGGNQKCFGSVRTMEGMNRDTSLLK